MICKNCGNFIPDGSTYCPSCGADNSVSQGAGYEAEGYNTYNPDPSYQPAYDPGSGYNAPAYGYGASSGYGYRAVTAEQQSLSTRILVFGILAMALTEFGIPSIVFGVLKRKLVNEYEAKYGPVSGKAKVGSILGQIGLIFGIVMTAIWTIYFLVYGIAIGGAACAAASDYSSYYLINLFH